MTSPLRCTHNGDKAADSTLMCRAAEVKTDAFSISSYPGVALPHGIDVKNWWV